MKWGVLAVFLLAFLFLAVSSFSYDMTSTRCYPPYYSCPSGYICQNYYCVPETQGTSPCEGTIELRENISKDFDITIHDNCDLDSEQLRVIYDILKVVPEQLHNVSKITTEQGDEKNHIIRLQWAYQWDVDEEKNDSIPDGIDQYADRFAILFIRELNNKIQQWRTYEFFKRRDELIHDAGGYNNNYIRSDYPDNYFLQHDYHFFPYTSQAYFQDSNRTFHFTIKRFKEVYREPINQFLFFADVFSLDSSQTGFYILNEQGVITRQTAQLWRDSNGHINSLYFQGERYYFQLDENGSVTGISKEPIVQKNNCTDQYGYEINHGDCDPANKPLYCDDGNWIDNCSYCNCPNNYECLGNGSCSEIQMTCDGVTPYGGCSNNQPLYCNYEGNFVNNCSFCGCTAGYECTTSEYCILSPTECSDGTPYGECSVDDNPKYCDNGQLVDRCDMCPCEAGVCQTDGSCYENTPPVIHSVGHKDVQEGGTLEFYIIASDPDGDYLTFFVQDLPDGAVFIQTADENKWKFSWTPDYDQTGIYWVTFLVLDDGEPTLGNQTQVRITVGEVNRPPEVEDLESIRTDENILAGFNIIASDPDGDELHYYAENLPEGASFNEGTGEFSWIPEFGQEGNYKVNFIVSDMEFNVSLEVLITVGDINRPPTAKIAHPIQNQEFFTNRNILFSAFGSHDPDGNQITYVWDFGDGQTRTTKNITISHIYVNPGKYNVSLIVSDGQLHDTEVVEIEIKMEVSRDSDNDGVEDSVDRCPATPLYDKVNIYGCTLPKYTIFKNNLTTDFTKVDLKEATNITIGIPGKGMVEFRKNTINLVDKDLNKYLEIGEKNISVNTQKVPELNKSAVITFYNVTIEEPIILRNGVYCPDCKVISYMKDSFSFSVPHFTTYSLFAWASYSGYCGDGLCSLYESCRDCENDCGECKEGPDDGEPVGIGPCEEFWVCSGWSECNELNLRERECMDVNLCGTRDKKPLETMGCRDGDDYTSIIYFASIIVILVFAYLITETYRKRRETKKMDEFELERFVKGYMYRGYTKTEIRKLLRSRGYTDNEIDNAIKSTEKEIF